MAVALLETLQRILVLLDGGLELFDVFGPPLAEGSLSLTVPLLPLLGRCVYLVSKSTSKSLACAD